MRRTLEDNAHVEAERGLIEETPMRRGRIPATRSIFKGNRGEIEDRRPDMAGESIQASLNEAQQGAVRPMEERREK